MKKNGQNSSGVQRVAGNEQWLASRVNFISKGKHSNAVWAMRLYERVGLKRNIHIRRLHYLALLQKGLTLPNGKGYRNTISDFDFLKKAFEDARLSGLVPYDVFSDSRNYSDFGFSVGAGLSGCDNARRQLLKQMIEQACRRHIRNMVARIAPVHVELWLERTGIADLIVPLADKYHLNIVASQAEISLTEIWRFVRRVSNASKPVRILYVSDFDLQTIGITAVDKVTAIMSQYGFSGKLDLKIMKLALTRNECDEYDLPCAPGPNAFKKHHIELHALEATAPGFLANTLETHVNRYCNYKPLRDAARQADDSINRLMVKINRTIDQETNLYKAINEVQSAISSN